MEKIPPRAKQNNPENAATLDAIEERLLARVTLVRHEETHYTGVGRDITEAGIARAQEKGGQLVDEKGAPKLLGTSPKQRAVGTGLSLLEGAAARAPGSDLAKQISIPNLQATKWRDPSYHPELVAKWGADNHTKWKDAHYNAPEFFDNPEKLETNEEKRTRLYREIDRLCSMLAKSPTLTEAPHMMFVSHYEILTLLLDDVFGIQNVGGTSKPEFGEHIDIDVCQPDADGNFPIRVTYQDHAADVVFDRSLRKMTARPTSRMDTYEK